MGSSESILFTLAFHNVPFHIFLPRLYTIPAKRHGDSGLTAENASRHESSKRVQTAEQNSAACCTGAIR